MYPETVTLAADNSGASGAPNRIQANTSGAVVIDGGATRASGIDAVYLSWFEFAGLTFTRATSEGVKVTGSSDVSFKDCIFDANKHGVYIAEGAHNTRYEGCRFTSSATAAIYYSANGTGEVITNCLFSANATALYTTAPSGQSIDVVSSVFYRNATAASVRGGNLSADRCVFMENGEGAYLHFNCSMTLTSSIVEIGRAHV